MSELTSEGMRLVADYLGSIQSVQQAKDRLGSAECDLSNTERALAKWLMPSDMKPGEKIGVWLGDSLFQVELEERKSYPVGEGEPMVSHEPKVTVRYRGKEFDRLRRAA